MGDVVLSNRARLVAGVRVEQFKEEVNTFDPFGLFVDRVTATLDNTDIFPGINMVYALKANMNVRAGYSQTVNRPEFRELASFEFTDVVGNRAVRGNPNLKRALIQNVDARWEMFGRGRGVFAVSGFYKHFQDPIERVIFASAQPLASFENADSARNFGLELELARELTRHVYVSANYTFVDSTITLSNAARQTQTSQERALAGQSKNLLNLAGEVTFGGFATRVLYNFFDDRISDVGASGAPDIIEKGRGSLDVVVSQRVGRMNVKLSLDNLTDAPYLFAQGGEDQRRFTLGRTVGLSVGFRAF
jgi:outer membrane cobalamin receptor